MDEIRDGYAESELTPRQKATLALTDAILAQPSGSDAPDEELRRALLTNFRPDEIVELAAGVALFMGFSKIAVALGQAPASMPVTEVPTPDLPGD